MPPSKRVTYKFANKKFITFDIYKTKDLLEINSEFAKNRSFNSWRDVFYPSMYKQIDKLRYKKRSYDKMANAYPERIISQFLDLVLTDIVEKEVEFVLNPKARKENQFVWKMGYAEKIAPSRFMKKTNFIFPYGGAHYLLRTTYPKNWRYPFIPRMACLYKPYRKKVWEQLNKGRRYYNSMKEKIFSNL